MQPLENVTRNKSFWWSCQKSNSLARIWISCLCKIEISAICYKRKPVNIGYGFITSNTFFFFFFARNSAITKFLMENLYKLTLPLFQVHKFFSGASRMECLQIELFECHLQFLLCQGCILCVNFDKNVAPIQCTNESFGFLLLTIDTFIFPGSMFPILERKSVTNLLPIELKTHLKCIENWKNKWCLSIKMKFNFLHLIFVFCHMSCE